MPAGKVRGIGELYRDDRGWHFRALGQGRHDGLAGIARQFGFDV